MVQEKFDAIVVGAGPAGISAALTMAKGGLKVILLERGQYPGAKNVMGGILYRDMLDTVAPGLSEQAPLERHITEQRYVLLGEGAATALGHRNEKFNQQPYNCFSVLRAKFDRWYAQQAVGAGVLLITETTATELIFEGERCVGVRTDREEGDLYAKVVILSDGANSLLAKQAGIHQEWRSDQMAVAVKEVLSLPKEKLMDRFNLEGNEGVALELVGDSSQGMVGIGFLYTNQETVSIGVGCLISEMVKTGAKPYELLDRMKSHPYVRRLIEGAQLEEYMAHMIPEGGLHAVPKVYGNGWMLCGNAAQLVNAVHREGSNLAMTSGRLAAETALEANRIGEFNERALSRYEQALKDSFVLKDLHKYRNFHHFTENFGEIFSRYPDLINDAAYEMFLVDGKPKLQKQREIMARFKKEIGVGRMLKTALAGWRAVK